jgi:hypothetical protein
MDKWIRWINKEVKAYGDVMKTVFTTGEAADICKVSQQRAVAWVSGAGKPVSADSAGCARAIHEGERDSARCAG